MEDGGWNQDETMMEPRRNSKKLLTCQLLVVVIHIYKFLYHRISGRKVLWKLFANRRAAKVLLGFRQCEELDALSREELLPRVIAARRLPGSSAFGKGR